LITWRTPRREKQTMTQLLMKPEQEIFPNRKRWTRQECARLVEKGELEGRYELIDGEILSKRGQNPLHMFTIMLAAQWLHKFFDTDYVRIQGPILLQGETGETNEPELDVAVTIGSASAYRSRRL
jgi:hypothetical protein